MTPNAATDKNNCAEEKCEKKTEGKRKTGKTCVHCKGMHSQRIDFTENSSVALWYSKLGYFTLNTRGERRVETAERKFLCNGVIGFLLSTLSLNKIIIWRILQENKKNKKNTKNSNNSNNNKKKEKEKGSSLNRNGYMYFTTDAKFSGNSPFHSVSKKKKVEAHQLQVISSLNNFSKTVYKKKILSKGLLFFSLF